MKALHGKGTKRKVSLQKGKSFRAGLCAIALALSLVPAGAFAADRTVSTNATSGAGSLSQALTDMSTATSDRFIVNIPANVSRDITLTGDLQNGANAGVIDYAANSVNYVRVLLNGHQYTAANRGTIAGTGDLLIGRAGAYNTNSTGKVHNVTLPAGAAPANPTIGSGLTVLGSANIAGAYNDNSLNVNTTAVTGTGAVVVQGAGVYLDGASAAGTTPAYTSSVNGATITGNTITVSGSTTAPATALGAGIYVDQAIPSFNATVRNNKATATAVAAASGTVTSSGAGAYFLNAPTTLTGTFTGNVAEATVAAPVGTATPSTAGAISHGGAIDIAAGTSTLSNLTATGNSAIATARNAASEARGGGVYLNSGTTTTILSNTIANNSANATSASAGSAATAQGGGLFAGSTANVTFGAATPAAGTVATTVDANSVAAINTAGAATAGGGGLYLSEALTVTDGNTINVTNNSVSANSATGAASAAGGGIFVEATKAVNSLRGVVSGNSVSAVSGATGTATAADGGLAANVAKTLTGVTFANNKVSAVAANGNADARSGALSFTNAANTFSGNLTGNSVSASNSFAPATAPTTKQTVTALGGAAFVAGNTLTVNGGNFTGNSVTATANTLGTDIVAGGGALFVDTTAASGVTLVAHDSNIRFADNSVTVNGNTRKNDITFGRTTVAGTSGAAAALNVYGSTAAATLPSYSVAIEDGIDVNMNNGQTFTLNREIRTNDRVNTFFWGGDNRLSTLGTNAASTVNLASGRTILTNDFTLNTPVTNVVADKTTALNLSFGQTHQLGLDLYSRYGRTALFNLRNAATSTLTVAEGSSIVAPTEVNRATGGKYLLIDGITDHATQSDHFVLEENSDKFHAYLTKTTGQLWIDYIWNPAGLRFSPNTERAFRSGALTQVLSGTDAIIALNAAGTDALIRDANSITPEAALTAGIIGERTHTAAADQAIRQNRFAFENKAHSQASLLSAESLAFNLEAKRQKAAAAPLAQNFDSANKIINNSNSARFMQALSLNLDAYGQKVSNQNELQQMYLDGGSASNGVSIWSTFFGNYGDLKNSKGYHGYEVDTNGFLLGASYKATPIWGLGLYGGYSHSDYDFKRIHAEGDADTFHAGIVSNVDYDDFYLSTDFAYSLSKNKLRRDPGKLNRTKGEFDQNTYSLGFELGYDIKYAETGKVTPFVGGRQTWLKQDSFSEKGGVIPSRVGKTDNSNFVSDLGIRIEHGFVLDNGTVLQPNASVAWQHRFSDDRLSASTNFLGLKNNEAPISYKIRSNKFGQDAIKAGVGLNADFELDNSQVISLSVGYDINAEEKNTEHNVYGGVKFSF